eukprot:429524-Alexandrium_andersonii.AAC.1
MWPASSLQPKWLQTSMQRLARLQRATCPPSLTHVRAHLPGMLAQFVLVLVLVLVLVRARRR